MPGAESVICARKSGLAAQVAGCATVRQRRNRSSTIKMNALLRGILPVCEFAVIAYTKFMRVHVGNSFIRPLTLTQA